MNGTQNRFKKAALASQPQTDVSGQASLLQSHGRKQQLYADNTKYKSGILIARMRTTSQAIGVMLVMAALNIRGIQSSCSSFQDVVTCRSLLDAVTDVSSRECPLAENCLKGLSCCCSVDMPYQQKIRCSVRKRDIGYEIFRLNVLCKKVVQQQPNLPNC